MLLILGQSLAWGAAMVVSALFSLWLSNGLVTSQITIIIVMCFITSVLGYLLAKLAAHLFLKHRPLETRFAGYLFFLIVMTIGCNVVFYCLNYWSFYSQWHAPFGSRLWVWQFVFTNLGAAYQYAVMGLRLYLPLGILFLILASLMNARRSRPDT